MNSNTNNIYNSEELIRGYIPEKPLSDAEAFNIEQDLEKKIKSSKRSIFNIIKHLKALKNYFKDKNVQWYRKSIVAAALIYFIVPIDAMPDFTPLIGYLDDIGVITWTIKFLGNEIKKYYD